MVAVETYIIYTTASAAFSAAAALINGHFGRAQRESELKLQKDHRKEDTQESLRRYEQDHDFRKIQFTWNQQEAEAAVLRRTKERMEDFLRQDIRERNTRSFDRIRDAFNGSPDGWYLHDANAQSNPGVKSLRILVQGPHQHSPDFQSSLEYGLAVAAHMYKQYGDDHPILFPTGLWKPDAQAGSWVSSELHAWDQATPTIVLRLNKFDDESFMAYGDIFGFPLGDTTFQHNIIFGKVPANAHQSSQVLSLIALSMADLYFLSNYGKAPLLPGILPQLLPDEGGATAGLVTELVNGYRQTLNTLIADNPEVALYASLKLAMALTALPDKTHALEQTREIERIAAPILAKQPALVRHLQNLYIETGAPQEAERLEQSVAAQNANQISTAKARLLLEKHI